VFALGLLVVETLGIVDCFGGAVDFLLILEGITVLLLFATAVRLVVDCKSEVGLLLGVESTPLGDTGDAGVVTMDFLL
jgi:hypothetical protein